MIIRIKRNSKRLKTVPFLVFFIFYTVIIFVSQRFYEDNLFETSIRLTSEFNKNEKLRNILLGFDKLGSFFGTYKSFGIFFILIFNLANVYKTFILIFATTLIYFITGILKMIYNSPLMYYSNYNREMYGEIVPVVCGGMWGNPCGSAASTTCVYLILWKIIFDCSRLRYKTLTKIISLILIILLILFLNFCKFLIALHSIDQIIFGMLIGFQLFFFIFYVLKVDINDGEDLMKIVSFNFFYYLLIYVLFAIIVVLTFFNSPIDLNLLQIYEINLKSTHCKNYPESLRFNNDSLVVCSYIFSTIGILIGMKLEFIHTFNRNEMNWRQYNFDKESGDEDSFISKLSIMKESQWNHTTFFFSFLRLIVSFFFHAFLFVPYHLIHWNNNLALVIAFKLFLPSFGSSVYMFYWEKIVLRKLGLTNEAVFNLLSDRDTL